MSDSQQTEAIARKFIDEYNKGKPEWVEQCHAQDIVWTELPIPGMTTGRGGGLDVLRQAAAQACAGFPDRRMTILSLTAQGNRAAMELDWRGTPAVARPGPEAGRQMKLRIAMFVEVRDGKISRQTDYCVPMPS